MPIQVAGTSGWRIGRRATAGVAVGGMARVGCGWWWVSGRIGGEGGGFMRPRPVRAVELFVAAPAFATFGAIDAEPRFGSDRPATFFVGVRVDDGTSEDGHEGCPDSCRSSETSRHHDATRYSAGVSERLSVRSSTSSLHGAGGSHLALRASLASIGGRVMRELVEVVEDDGDGGEVFSEPGEVAPADDVAGVGFGGVSMWEGHVMGTS